MISFRRFEKNYTIKKKLYTLSLFYVVIFQVFVIYLGTDYDKGYVQSLASMPTDDHVLFLETAKDLMTDTGKNFFKQKFCHRKYF